VNLSGSHLRLTRAGIFVLLAVLVALLGAAAKHSLFDGPPHHGFLSKAVKMAAARATYELADEFACDVTSPVQTMLHRINEDVVNIWETARGFQFLAVLSPPLRV
jgi:hypothetical protein